MRLTLHIHVFCVLTVWLCQSMAVSLLFIFYAFDLMQLIEGHGLGPHLFADDTQVGT